MSLGVAAMGTRPRLQKRLSRNACLRSATLIPVRTPTPGESAQDVRRRDCFHIGVCPPGVQLLAAEDDRSPPVGTRQLRLLGRPLDANNSTMCLSGVEES